MDICIHIYIELRHVGSSSQIMRKWGIYTDCGAQDHALWCIYQHAVTVFSDISRKCWNLRSRKQPEPLPLSPLKRDLMIHSDYAAKSLQVVIMLYHINLSNVIQFRSSWDPPICSARSEGPSSKQWAHPSGQQKALCQLVRFVRKWEPARLLIEREVRSQRFGGDTTPTIQPFVLLNPQRSPNPILHHDVPQYTGANHGTGPSL
jgi:hypothetical protein